MRRISGCPVGTAFHINMCPPNLVAWRDSYLNLLNAALSYKDIFRLERDLFSERSHSPYRMRRLFISVTPSSHARLGVGYCHGSVRRPSSTTTAAGTFSYYAISPIPSSCYAGASAKEIVPSSENETTSPGYKSKCSPSRHRCDYDPSCPILVSQYDQARDFAPAPGSVSCIQDSTSCDLREI